MKSSRDQYPPRWADQFLQWYCRDEFIEEIQGDLHEAYYKRVESKGVWFASVLFVAEVFQSLSYKTVKAPTYSTTMSINMLQNNIRIFFRKIAKRKALAAINIIGLSVSLTGALLIYLYVVNELTFDQFNVNGDRIYRMYCAYAQPGESVVEFPYTPPPFASSVRTEIEGVEQIARIMEDGSTLVNVEAHTYNETKFFRADPSFFNIFTATFLEGDASTALSAANAVVLTKSTAEKYFGSAPALNKDIKINATDIYTVTGVVDDFPSNSHLIFSGLLSIDPRNENTQPDNWLAHYPVTYLLLKKGARADQVQNRIRLMTERILEPIFLGRFGKSYSDQKAAGGLQEYRMQPLRKVHLYSSHMGDSNDITTIYVFIAIGLVLITISSFNYINLTTAQSTWEARNTGVRKVLGATKAQVYKLFITESIGTALIAFILAILAAQTILMLDTAFLRQFIPHTYIPTGTLLRFAGVTLVIGTLSGLIPSRLLSSFEPISVLKGQLTRGSGGNNLRQILVVTQFVVSMALLTCTLLVGEQLKFITSQSLGFNKENLLVIDHIDQLGTSKTTLKDEVSKFNGVEMASLCYGKIGQPSNSAAFTPVEMIEEQKDLVIGIPIYLGDEDYLKTLGVKMVAGHAFPAGLPKERQQIILNREAIRQVGWQERKDIIGQMIDVNGQRYELAAVVEDYNFISLRHRIGPLAILSHYWNDYNSLIIRLKPGSTREAVAHFESTWKKIKPDVPFGYSFVDEDLGHLYAAEQNLGVLFTCFAGIAIFVSCLGLLGLAMFIAEKNIKEISIRKVLGASVQSIVLRLSSNMIKLVAISFAVATPLAWYISKEWLDSFAYRIPMNALPFIMAGVFTLTMAIATMSFQTIKAALANPAESLRKE